MPDDVPTATPTRHESSPPDDGAEAVHRRIALDVDVADAWHLVATEDGLARWLGAEVELDPGPGGALRLTEHDGTVRTGRVIEVEEGRRLAFEWAPTDDPEAASTVTITVDGDDGSATVSVAEGRGGGRLAARSEVVADVGAAWDHRALQLELCALSVLRATAAVA